jgi:hypothetical protein
MRKGYRLDEHDCIAVAERLVLQQVPNGSPF